MDDFTRLTIVIPSNAVGAVRMGTSVSVNGVPLCVASVNEDSMIFGISSSSSLAATLSALPQTVDVAIEVEEGFHRVPVNESTGRSGGRRRLAAAAAEDPPRRRGATTRPS